MKTLGFEGNGSEYFKIWIVNILLTIITLGLYYPWAKVRSRQYFYGNSTLEGRNFEYHATGKQLFVGYLIAMALFITYIVIKELFPAASIVFIVVLMLAVPWLIVKSMMFNMKMSSFSNVHFNFEGKTAQAYINYLAYPLAMYVGLILLMVAGITVRRHVDGAAGGLLTLIIVIGAIAFMIFAFAYIKKRNTEFFIDNSRYGQGDFKTDVTTSKLMSIAFNTFGVAIFVFLLSGVIVGIGAGLFGGMGELAAVKDMSGDPEHTAALMKSLVPVLAITYAVLIIASIFVIAYSTARHREYIFANTKLDNNISFASTLKAMPYGWLLVSNLLLVVMTLGLAFPWTKVRAARMVLENTSVKAENGFDSYLTQKQDQTSALGDQIGDVFDVDVGIGF